MGKFFLDTEFHEYKKRVSVNYGGVNGIGQILEIPTIELISIGIVREDGEEFYAISKEFDVPAAWDNEWLRKNVLQPICSETLGQTNQNYLNNDLELVLQNNGLSRQRIKDLILNFIGDDMNPVFYGWHADYDYVVFVQIFGGMKGYPKGFPFYFRDLKQTIDERNLAIHQPENNAHNALNNARWAKQLYEICYLEDSISDEDNIHNNQTMNCS